MNKILIEAAGSWKDFLNEDGVEYVRNIRAGWAKRRKRLGL